jgi:diguanylate cyclase (GGDEF)-like protein
MPGRIFLLQMAQKPGHILIVDDAPENFTVLQAMLSREGYTVRHAGSGEKALQAVQAELPELILLDIMMPVMDGYEVCRQLKSDPHTSDIPVLFISALKDIPDKVKGFQTGCVDYITKPFRHEDVLSRVQTHLSLRYMQKDLQDKNMLLMHEIGERRKAEKALEDANRILRRMASLDGLTLIANRRHFNKIIWHEWRRLAREKQPLSLVLCDIDHFKLYNDIYGHVQGDECLKKIARCISRCVCRPADMAARYGGEVFALLLPNTPLEGARHVAEKVRRKIDELQIPHRGSGSGPHISLSMGIACRIPVHTSSPEHLVHDADTALYNAKNSGRNRIATL